MGRITSVRLVRVEHAHYTKVCAEDCYGNVVDYYNTSIDDVDECTKLWVMEKRLNYRNYEIASNLERVMRVNE